MSAFLGPIHFWLYNKIKIQNTIVEETLNLSENKNINLRDNLYEQFGDGELKPLDEVVDTANIHGWLQEQISKVENKLAVVVTETLKKEPSMKSDIKKIFYDNGKKSSSLNNDSTIEEIFKAINDTLLDGMPCDHVNALVSQDEDEVIWKRCECVHSKYWDAANGDAVNYYELRDEFIKGLLEKTNANYEKINDVTSKIYRR